MASKPTDFCDNCSGRLIEGTIGGQCLQQNFTIPRGVFDGESVDYETFLEENPLVHRDINGTFFLQLMVPLLDYPPEKIRARVLPTNKLEITAFKDDLKALDSTFQLPPGCKKEHISCILDRGILKISVEIANCGRRKKQERS